MLLVHRSDKRKAAPIKDKYRPLTLAEAQALPTWPATGFDPTLYWIDNSGRAANVRRNGKVKIWKRDASRVEVPLKFGLYECWRATEADILAGKLLVRDECNADKENEG